MTSAQEWRKLLLAEIKEVKSELHSVRKEVHHIREQLTNLRIKVAAASAVIGLATSYLANHFLK